MSRSPSASLTAVIPVLQSGVLQHHQVEKVGFAGHPEDHPEVSRDVLQRALIEKIAVAKASQMDCYVVTQFCFAARPFFDFLSWMREQEFDVPVRLGIAGRVNAAKLFKFAASAGLDGPCLFARRQFGKTVNLVNYSPEGILAELSARIAVRDYSFPVGLHFYPFTATVEDAVACFRRHVNQGEGGGFYSLSFQQRRREKMSIKKLSEAGGHLAKRSVGPEGAAGADSVAAKRRLPFQTGDEGLTAEGSRLLIDQRVRKGPYWHLSQEAGAWCHSIYNRIYHPRAYIKPEDGGLMEEYKYLTEHVTMWNVAVERQIQVKGPGRREVCRHGHHPSRQRLRGDEGALCHSLQPVWRDIERSGHVAAGGG